MQDLISKMSEATSSDVDPCEKPPAAGDLNMTDNPQKSSNQTEKATGIESNPTSVAEAGKYCLS